MQLELADLAFDASRSLSLGSAGSYRPSSSQISVPFSAQILISCCQSALSRASREHSSPSTIPARPSDTSPTSCWNPARSAADAPEDPWSTSMTWTWEGCQPSATARPLRSYWRRVDSVLWMTWYIVDCRTYR